MSFSYYRWVNVYQNGPSAYLYTTKHEADNADNAEGSERLACVKVDVTDAKSMEATSILGDLLVPFLQRRLPDYLRAHADDITTGICQYIQTKMSPELDS